MRTVAEAVSVPYECAMLHNAIDKIIDESNLSNMEAVSVLEAVKFKLLKETIQ